MQNLIVTPYLPNDWLSLDPSIMQWKKRALFRVQMVEETQEERFIFIIIGLNDFRIKPMLSVHEDSVMLDYVSEKHSRY